MYVEEAIYVDKGSKLKRININMFKFMLINFWTHKQYHSSSTELYTIAFCALKNSEDSKKWNQVKVTIFQTSGHNKYRLKFLFKIFLLKQFTIAAESCHWRQKKKWKSVEAYFCEIFCCFPWHEK